MQKTRSVKSWAVTATLAGAVGLLAACGGGGGGGSAGFFPLPNAGGGQSQPPGPVGGDPGNPGPGGTPAPGGNPNASFSIGGKVSGLLGPVTLLLNGTNILKVDTDGDFKFPTALANGTAYAVTVSAAPLWQQCAVAEGSGTALTDINTVAVTCGAPTAAVSKLAGADDQSAGAADGKGSSASFAAPMGLTFDAGGNLLISDSGNAAIRSLALDGTVTTRPLNGEAMAGQGHLVFNNFGEMFVAGHAGQRVYKIFPDGRTLGLGPFVNATGVAMNAAGDLFVADFTASKITKHGSTGGVKTLALDASIGAPFGVAVDGNGTLFVTDQATHRVLKIENESHVTVLAGSTRGNVDGEGSAAKFNFPQGIAVGPGRMVYVTDTNTVRAIFPTGIVATLAGKGETAGAADGVGAAARFADPSAVAVGPNGDLYVTDSLNNSVRKLSKP
ncbi:MULTISPECIES: hypothetical protein [Variovorax]|uniref:hypothetical protein n=1 Tax=Variovorax TaxID=34072 RepID=UPI00285E5B1B|nr:hypothetical protein [Variovorax sp. 3319]MDR6890966.1 streptogramin lyase [Variovorax sp. 3319]